ncbi:uncharacterized protein PAC_14758 [Phialocephala subalpina]|uniref:NACHT-NTPase and P-loop NTPases N-terminal domain-containing protein n=1 Tax=Phialocephala subalpina TaxID=576137 RepID=A0A1L7XII5_9HELO|nr:uncharacterized protein PAC_14758 [Phialocephala subalpina]
MDPLSAIGLASAIVQFVQFGLTVAGRLQEFSSSSPSDVPQSLRSISTQLPLLFNALSRIKSSTSIETLDFDTKCILKGMVSGCYEQVKSIEKMVIEITPKEGETLKQRIKKVFTSLKYDERVWEVERNLQTYVQVLILHHVIDEKDVPEKFGEEAFFDVREKRADGFVERKKEMVGLEEGLRDVVWGKTKNPVILMVAGEKGTGKTQLVLDFVHQTHGLSQFRTVFWIDASSLENLSLGFESMYATIKRSTDGSRAEKIRFVKEFLNDLWHPWLLVLDNYESKALYNDIMEFLPCRGYGGIIFITRNEAESGLGKVLHIPKFTTQEDQTRLDSLLTQEVQRKNVEGIKNLVSQGASPDALIWNEWPCLHRSALFGLHDAVTFLLDSGANPNPPGVNIRKLFYWAASGGSVAVCETLLDHEDRVGIYTNQADNQSAFNVACDEGHLEIIKMIMKRREVNLSAKNRYDETPLQSVARKGHFEIVKFLIDKGALTNDHIQGNQALIGAASAGHFEIVKLLCGIGKVDPNVQDKQGISPLCYAAKSRDESTYKENGLKIAKFLLEKGADATLVGEYSGPLNEAALFGHLEMAKLLLEHGADPMRDVNGWCPLTNAIKYKCPEIIDLLLNANIEDQEARKKWLEKGLRSTCRLDDRAAALKLLKAGADVDAVEESGVPKGASPLLIAILNGYTKLGQFLIRQKARQDLADEKGRVPLSVAAESGYELLVRDLIKAGGDKDLKSGENEDTLLILATANGHENVVRVLLEAGADREECNKFGDVAMDIAEEKKNKKIIALLEDWVKA